jgi:hypothetical protein
MPRWLASRPLAHHDRPNVVRRLRGLDVRAVAASLTWLGERLYYLAAAGVPPFTDGAVLVDTLTYAWVGALYADPDPDPLSGDAR